MIAVPKVARMRSMEIILTRETIQTLSRFKTQTGPRKICLMILTKMTVMKRAAKRESSLPV
jgi:hypothetical protein